MRKNIKTTEAIFPMPVLLIGTYNEDNSVNVMNAAWGTMYDRDVVLLNLDENHKTYKNIMNKKAFTVSLANTEILKEADFFGIVSGNKYKNKFEKSGLTSVKSDNIDAPIINEAPICLECTLIEDESTSLVLGKVVSVTADTKVLKDGKVDISLLNAVAFDPYTHGYYKVSERVGNAFKDGLELK